MQSNTEKNRLKKIRAARLAHARRIREERAFERGYQELLRYLAEPDPNTGKMRDANVHAEHTIEKEDGKIYRLGRWVANQRIKHRKGSVPESQQQRLEKLAGWTWNAWDRDWDRGLALLTQYAQREGHARCPLRHTEDEFALGRWLSRQRLRYRQGRLSEHQVQALKSFKDAIVNWRDVRANEFWTQKYRALTLFAKHHGHASVPRRYVTDKQGNPLPDFPKTKQEKARCLTLGVWVNSLRSLKRKGRLSEQRIQELEKIPGWRWADSRQ